jgi:hypothetical protein
MRLRKSVLSLAGAALVLGTLALGALPASAAPASGPSLTAVAVNSSGVGTYAFYFEGCTDTLYVNEYTSKYDYGNVKLTMESAPCYYGGVTSTYQAYINCSGYGIYSAKMGNGGSDKGQSVIAACDRSHPNFHFGGFRVEPVSTWYDYFNLVT